MSNLRTHLEGFYVWERHNDGAAIAEAPGIVSTYLDEHTQSNRVQPHSVPYMLALAEKLHKDRVIACCVTCDHFDHKLELCRLAMQRPPAQVIAYGCPSWSDEDLPF